LFTHLGHDQIQAGQRWKIRDQRMETHNATQIDAARRREFSYSYFGLEQFAGMHVSGLIGKIVQGKPRLAFKNG
jgi:hypothetical protein